MPDVSCWICGDKGNSREHLIKKSDLEGLFGKPKTRDPLFLHDANRKNYKVQGLNSDALKLKSPLCAKCNNERSQPYDRAWEAYSHFLRNRNPPIYVGTRVPADRIFSQNAKEEMRRVQLYFVKLFGCLIQDALIPIDLKSFSEALLTGKFHKDIFLKIGCAPRQEQAVGVAGLATATDNRSGQVVGAHWFYDLGRVTVLVIYSPIHGLWEATSTAWHPMHRKSRLWIEDFSSMLKTQAVTAEG